MFFCAISGEPPQDPVISTKSGHVYERRLVQKYITENGTDPVTGEKLEESDLVSVKASTYIPVLVMRPYSKILRSWCGCSSTSDSLIHTRAVDCPAK
jgi:SUMO ligase MMS21 Smc5/6 complex component